MSQDAGTDHGNAFSVSPLDPPRARVTLLRWMVLIVVVAVGFAWGTPALWPVAVLPVVFAAMVPGGTTWFAVEASAAVGWLLSAIASFSEVEPEFFELLLLFVMGLGIAVSWTIRLFRRRSSKSPWTYLITPAIGMIGLILLTTDRDFELRLRLSEPALRASAARYVPDPKGWSTPTSSRVGLIWPTDMERVGACTIWWTRGGFLDSVGVAYVPSGVHPQSIPGMGRYRFNQIHGPWWRVIEPF